MLQAGGGMTVGTVEGEGDPVPWVRGVRSPFEPNSETAREINLAARMTTATTTSKATKRRSV
jgi:hypothetical protein